MIRLIDRLPDIKPSKMSEARIFSAFEAFDGSPIENDLWGQYEGDKLTALIWRAGGSMSISFDGRNTEELKEFLEVLSPAEIFTEYEAAKSLSLSPLRVRNMLTCSSDGSDTALEEFTLQELYDGLSFGTDVDIHLPAFEVFAADVSHRLRHGKARAVVKDYGAALAFTYSGGALMTGIALKPDFRGQGLGKKLLSELLSGICGDFFVAANDNNTKFYENFGLTLSGRVGYWRLK